MENLKLVVLTIPSPEYLLITFLGFIMVCKVIGKSVPMSSCLEYPVTFSVAAFTSVISPSALMVTSGSGWPR